MASPEIALTCNAPEIALTCNAPEIALTCNVFEEEIALTCNTFEESQDYNVIKMTLIRVTGLSKLIRIENTRQRHTCRIQVRKTRWLDRYPRPEVCVHNGGQSYSSSIKSGRGDLRRATLGAMISSINQINKSS